MIEIPRYEAREGYVWDWAQPMYTIARDEDGNEIIGELVQTHLYKKIIFMNGNDKIENYVEVAEPVG